MSQSKTPFQVRFQAAFGVPVDQDTEKAYRDYIKPRVPGATIPHLIQAIDNLADTGLYNGDFRRPTTNELCKAVRAVVYGDYKPIYPACDKCDRGSGPTGWAYVLRPGGVDKAAVPCDCAKGRKMAGLNSDNRKAKA